MPVLREADHAGELQSRITSVLPIGPADMILHRPIRTTRLIVTDRIGRVGCPVVQQRRIGRRVVHIPLSLLIVQPCGILDHCTEAKIGTTPDQHRHNRTSHGMPDHDRPATVDMFKIFNGFLKRLIRGFEWTSELSIGISRRQAMPQHIDRNHAKIMTEIVDVVGPGNRRVAHAVQQDDKGTIRIARCNEAEHAPHPAHSFASNQRVMVVGCVIAVPTTAAHAPAAMT